MYKTQDETVLEWLESGKSITSWDAIQMWKHTRLGASINRLKAKGYQIEGEIEINQETKKHWKRYFLVTAYALLVFFFMITDSFAQLKPAYTDEQVVRAIIGEAGNQGFQGMYAVACAIINRGTLKGVYGLKSKQVDKEPAWVWKMARKAFSDAKKAIVAERAKYGNHWENIKAFGNPKWAAKMKEVYRYKDHVFYKGV